MPRIDELAAQLKGFVKEADEELIKQMRSCQASRKNVMALEAEILNLRKEVKSLSGIGDIAQSLGASYSDVAYAKEIKKALTSGSLARHVMSAIDEVQDKIDEVSKVSLLQGIAMKKAKAQVSMIRTMLKKVMKKYGL